MTAIIVAGFLFVAVHLAMFGGGINTNWDALRVILGLALLGAVLGFIPYNFNPASIFMGDTGSMFLGFCCGTLIILMAQAQSKWFLASMVMFALPVLDTSLAFARRWIAGRPLFSADAQHFHHQLVQRGFTVKQTVMISYGLAIAFALLGRHRLHANALCRRALPGDLRVDHRGGVQDGHGSRARAKRRPFNPRETPTRMRLRPISIDPAKRFRDT